MTIRKANGQFELGTHWRPRKPHWDRAWLEHQIVALARSAADVAAEVGVGESAIDYWTTKHGIQRRTTSEVRATKHWGASGAANPMFGKRGAEVPSWKGGVTAERQAFNSSPEWREAMRLVWARDRATCRCCTTKHVHGRRYDVHHVISFSVPELRTEVTNLVLLCRACHRWVHSKKNVAKEWLA